MIFSNKSFKKVFYLVILSLYGSRIPPPPSPLGGGKWCGTFVVRKGERKEVMQKGKLGTTNIA
jgi:hypothetical protein